MKYKLKKKLSKHHNKKKKINILQKIKKKIKN